MLPPSEEPPAQKELVCRSCGEQFPDHPRGFAYWNKHVKTCKGKTKAMAFLKPQTPASLGARLAGPRRNSRRTTFYEKLPTSPRSSSSSISPSSSSLSFHHHRRPSEPVVRQQDLPGLSTPGSISASTRYPGNRTRSASQSHLPTPAQGLQGRNITQPLPPLDIPPRPQNSAPQSDESRFPNGQITMPSTPEYRQSIPTHDWSSSPPSAMSSSSSSSSTSLWNPYWNASFSQNHSPRFYPPSWNGSQSPAMPSAGSSSSAAQLYAAHYQNNLPPYSPPSPTDAGPSPNGDLAVPSLDAPWSPSVASDLASGSQHQPDQSDLFDDTSAEDIGELLKRLSQSGL